MTNYIYSIHKRVFNNVESSAFNRGLATATILTISSSVSILLSPFIDSSSFITILSLSVAIFYEIIRLLIGYQFIKSVNYYSKFKLYIIYICSILIPFGILALNCFVIYFKHKN